ncbi:MAG: hypothetical protein IPF73_19620 [Betaproteobacteria bacterium]|nr:hypothetical protein [Betaproteobacteria bacterium]
MPTGEEVERSRVHALRHLEHDFGAGQRDPAHDPEPRAHLDRRLACAREVAVAFEPQEQRVAAELEQAAAGVVGDRQDRLEALADHLGDLLGSLAAFRRELLGELREARDVRECRSAFSDPALRARIGDQMLLQHPRDVERRPPACAGDRCGGLVWGSGTLRVLAAHGNDGIVSNWRRKR